MRTAVLRPLRPLRPCGFFFHRERPNKPVLTTGQSFGPAATQHEEPSSYPHYFQRAFERGLARVDATRAMSMGTVATCQLSFAEVDKLRPSPPSELRSRWGRGVLDGRQSWQTASMDPRGYTPTLTAPGAVTHSVSAPSGRGVPRQPAIDENVLGEGCGYEIVEGQVYRLEPAEEDHGTEHFDLPGLLKHCLAPAYKGAVDMLSRPSVGSNFAPDVSIVARDRDPATGGRHLEEVVFEVLDTESLAHVTEKTRRMITRGVRRAFLVDVNDRSVREWSRQDDDWVTLGDDAVITDHCLSVPLPARALVDEILNENTVARSLSGPASGTSGPSHGRMSATAPSAGSHRAFAMLQRSRASQGTPRHRAPSHRSMPRVCSRR